MVIEFSQFTNGGVAEQGDIVVGLRAGLNTQFTFPSVVGTTWNFVTTNTVMEAYNGYAVSTMGTVVLTIPSSIEFGQFFEVLNCGSGAVVIQCAAGQTLQLGTVSSSVGGSLSASSTGAAIKILACSTTQLMVLSGVGMNLVLA